MRKKICGLLMLFVALFATVGCGDHEPKNVVIEVVNISLDKDEISLTVGQKVTLQAKISPDNATDKQIKWESSNTSVATIDNGVIEALAPGTTEIVALCGNVSAKCKVQVNSQYIAVEKVTLDNEEVSLTVGETKSLKVSILPEDATDNHIEWESSNPTVAKVADGVVTALSKGTAKITATIGDLSATCTVFVDKYQYVFGYVYSEDLLKFLTPTITVTLEGTAPVKYTIEDGNHSSTEDRINYGDLSIVMATDSASVWWIGQSFSAEQKGDIQITYERKDVDYSLYDDVDISSLYNLMSKPFVDQSRGSLTISTHAWTMITIPIGGGLKLEEIIDNIVKSSSNKIAF